MKRIITLTILLLSIIMRADEILAISEWPNGYTLDSLKISGNGYYPWETVNKELNTNRYINKEFTPLEAQNLIKEFVDYYNYQGFPFATIKLTQIAINDSLKKLQIKIDVESGDLITLSFIDYLGIKSNRPSILNLLSRLKSPTQFDLQQIKQSEQYLFNSAYFSSYPIWQIAKDSIRGYGLQFTLEEERYNSIDAIAGYSDNQKSKGVTGKIELDFKNILGTMRQAKILWNRKDNSNESMALYYKEPFLFSYPLSTALSFKQDFTELAYLERYLGVETAYQLDQSFNISSEFIYGEIKPDSILISQGERNVTKLTTGIGISYKKSKLNRDYVQTNLKLSSFDKKSDNNKDRGYILSLKSNWQRTVWSNFSIRQNINFEYITADSLNSYDLFKFGGHNSLRGYLEDQFRTDIYLLNRNNLFWHFALQNGLFIFFDTALYHNATKNISLSNSSTLSGYGGGITFQNNIGVFEVSYGIALKEGFSTAKLHLAYQNKF